MSDLVEVASLWIKQDKNGNQYLAGVTKDKESRVMVFKNKNKKNERQPDYTVFKAANEKFVPPPVKEEAPKVDERVQEASFDQESIPF